jgi:hypothetical protein
LVAFRFHRVAALAPADEGAASAVKAATATTRPMARLRNDFTFSPSVYRGTAN